MMRRTEFVSSSDVAVSAPPSLKTTTVTEKTMISGTPPPREVLVLIDNRFLDPESVAIASCVSKTWCEVFSTEILWRNMLQEYHPNLLVFVNESATSKRILSAKQEDVKCRTGQPEKIFLSFSDLKFFVSLTRESYNMTIEKCGKDLSFGVDNPFELEFRLSDPNFHDKMKKMRVLWYVVYKDWEALFTVIDTEEDLGWFSFELPSLDRFQTGKVGYVKTYFKNHLLEKMTFSMANKHPSWKVLTGDDALRYFQRCSKVKPYKVRNSS
ncbi:unnamed protein product [Arabis nemorensis]|uniref:F-box domain-containing protein n=1 Tax=Arabis nemorensis TaxID=586526 RepID=A0A565CHJ0_9BRAS|nr:unnamed protein product [Arabis nemorensis]